MNKVLELFCGSKSFANVAKRRGYRTFTSDIEPGYDPDYAVDILDFDVTKVPFHPDIIWASPPCTYFSVASIGKHWNRDHTPKTKEAELGVAIVKRTVEIIDKLEPTYWIIENPRGKLRKLDLIGGWMNTVTYCQYGDTRMKPTDIWTNFTWVPRPICKNGDPCHEKAPRGSKTGTQGLDGSYDRSKVPSELCNELLDVMEAYE